MSTPGETPKRPPRMFGDLRTCASGGCPYLAAPGSCFCHTHQMRDLLGYPPRRGGRGYLRRGGAPLPPPLSWRTPMPPPEDPNEAPSFAEATADEIEMAPDVADFLEAAEEAIVQAGLVSDATETATLWWLHQHGRALA